MTKLGYYRRLLAIYSAYKRKKIVLPYLPLRLWVEPTSFCNLKCVMCPNKDMPKDEKGYMDFSLFRKTIDEAAAFVHEINLTHRGESLLHPDFMAMIGYASQAGIVTKLHSNGTMLGEDKIGPLLDSGLDQLTFSFDGYDAATYESIRINADFEKTLGSIIRFLEVKKSRGRKKPTTILELIDFPEVYKNVGPEVRRNFLLRFKGLPLDKVRIKDMHNWAGEIPGGRRSRKYSACTFLWASLVVFWDGSVCPCTQDFHGDLNTENVREASLASIWNGEAMQNLRRKAVRGDIEDLGPCSGCDRPWRDTFLGVPREYFWKLLLRKMP